MATISKYQTKSGATLYRVRYRTPDGRQTDKRGFVTNREAKQFAATVEVSKLRGEYVAPTVGRVTVGELGPAWLARHMAVLKPSGLHSYENAWRKHVLPYWGSVQLAAIQRSVVQAWVSELATKYAPATVGRAHSILSRILDDAVADRLLATNPARGVKLPRNTKHRNVYLTAEQLHHLADEAGDYGSLVLLLGTTGLRWGEAAALRVSDVNFLRRRINLHANAVAVGGQMILGTLKSGKDRMVPVPAFVIDALSVTCADKSRGDLMWSSASGGYLRPPGRGSWLASAVARCQAADPTFPRVTAHSLRHTAASLAISAGANVKAVQRMLGHASAAMTLDVYADLFDDDLEAVAVRLDDVIASAKETAR